MGGGENAFESSVASVAVANDSKKILLLLLLLLQQNTPSNKTETIPNKRINRCVICVSHCFLFLQICQQNKKKFCGRKQTTILIIF